MSYIWREVIFSSSFSNFITAKWYLLGQQRNSVAVLNPAIDIMKRANKKKFNDVLNVEWAQIFKQRPVKYNSRHFFIRILLP